MGQDEVEDGVKEVQTWGRVPRWIRQRADTAMSTDQMRRSSQARDAESVEVCLGSQDASIVSEADFDRLTVSAVLHQRLTGTPRSHDCAQCLSIFLRVRVVVVL